MILGERYNSKAQKIRAISESWAAKNMFCPCCGNSHIFALKNNEPVADMKCNNCGAIFELKSKEGKIGKKKTTRATARRSGWTGCNICPKRIRVISIALEEVRFKLYQSKI